MARNFVKASSQWLDTGSVRNVPLTMAFWAKTTDFVNTNTMMAWENGINNCERYMLLRGATTKKVTASENNFGVGFTEASSTATPASATWFHACGTWQSTTSRTIYLNGTAVTDATALANFGNSFTLNFGRLGAGTNYFDGDMAEACFWNVALTASDVATLVKGFNPRRIRPQNLLGQGGQHWRMFSGDTHFYSPMGSALVNHSTTGSTHPRIYA